MTDEKLAKAKELQQKIAVRAEDIRVMENGNKLFVMTSSSRMIRLPDMVMQIITGIVISTVEQDLAALKAEYEAL